LIGVRATRECWICKGKFGEDMPMIGDSYRIACRSCGTYFITGSLHASEFPLPDTERYRVSYWGKRRELDGREPPVLTSETFASVVAQLENPRPSSKADLLLGSLSKIFPVAGQEMPPLDVFREYSLACARDGRELSFFFSALAERNLVHAGVSGKFSITQAGWERVEALSNSPMIAKFAFVAIRFSDDMLPLWKSSFQPAISRAGFDALLSNDPAHNERIDARIITDIKRSRFLIADVTHQSPGVYFEAGYAIGLGRPVIWTCRADRGKSDMHFDTRQYNHILWANPTELAEQLFLRIGATI
jgi:nucleoside 2-deoxyribosyltransferase